MIRRLVTEQVLPISLAEAWDFFSTPKNLNDITPPHLQFEMMSGHESEMHEGQILVYRIRLLAGFKRAWVTEIKSVEFQRQFVDEQRFGPYRFWHHRHTFEETAEGVRMTDIIHYDVGFGVIGALVDRAYVTPTVRMIFSYREQTLSKRFPR